jgi:GNAT superfamily N-acetyltransferase
MRPTTRNYILRITLAPLLLVRRLAQAALVEAQKRTLYRMVGRRITRGMVISRATEQDLIVLHRYLRPRAERLFNPRDAETVVWVAKWRSHILGCAKTVHERDESSPWSGYWLNDLWVRPRYRGLGVGERLTRYRLEQARLEGVPQVLILVFQENERSIRLHQKLGFETITIPALEPVLAVQLAAVGKRHFTMRKTLTNPDSPSEGTELGPITV